MLRHGVARARGARGARTGPAEPSPTRSAVALERHRRAHCRRRPKPGEDDLGVARRGRPRSSRSGADGDQGQSQGGQPPRRHPAAVPGPPHWLSRARRPAQLRNDPLRGRPHHLRDDRQSSRPAGRHPRAQRAHLRRGAAAGDRAPGWGPRAQARRDPRRARHHQRARSSRATCACRSRKRFTTCSPGRTGTFNFEADVRAGPRGFPGLDQPGVAAARGRAPGRRVEPDREEDSRRSISSSRWIRRTSTSRGPSSPPSSADWCRSSTGAATCSRSSTTRGWSSSRSARRSSDSSPPASPTASARPPTAAPKVNDGRVEEHRNLGVAFYKAGMFDEALREFRRVAELRPADASAPFHLGLIALRQARWADAADAFRQACGGRRCAAGRRFTTWACALERLGRLDEAEVAFGDAAARARDDARIMLGWSVVALKRGEYQVAQGRLARALELLGGKPAPALWYWAATLAAAGSDDQAGALRAARAGVDGASRPSRAPEQSRRAARASGDMARPPRPCCARRSPRTRRCRSSQESRRRALPERPLRRGAASVRARGQAHRPISATTSTSSSATSPTSAARRRRRGRAGAARPTLNPGHELARTNLEMLDMAPMSAGGRAGFADADPEDLRGLRLPLEAYKDKCIRRRIAVRMRACGVHTYADYGRCSTRRRTSTTGCSTRSRSTSPGSTGIRRRGT